MMHALCSHERQALVGEAPRELDRGLAPASHRGRGRFAGTAHDLGLIALAWIILIGAVVYPGTQVIAILVCSIALMFSGGEDEGQLAVKT